MAQHQVYEAENQEEYDRIIKDKYEEYLVRYEANVQEAQSNYTRDYPIKKAEYDAQRDPIIEYYDDAVAGRSDYCAKESKPIGSTYEVPIKNTDLTT